MFFDTKSYSIYLYLKMSTYSHSSKICQQSVSSTCTSLSSSSLHTVVTRFRLKGMEPKKLIINHPFCSVCFTLWYSIERSWVVYYPLFFVCFHQSIIVFIITKRFGSYTTTFISGIIIITKNILLFMLH